MDEWGVREQISQLGKAKYTTSHQNAWAVGQQRVDTKHTISRDTQTKEKEEEKETVQKSQVQFKKD